jgi:hypothetical protein
VLLRPVDARRTGLVPSAAYDRLVGHLSKGANIMSVRFVHRLALVGAIICGTAAATLVGTAVAEEHSHALRGPHPAAGEPDPYRVTRNVRGGDCCHGNDCSRYNGPAPVRATRQGISGMLFAGRWFFAEDQRIDPATLDVEVRGEPVICIGTYGTPYCYHWPMNG